MNTQFTSFSHFSQKHNAFVRRHSCKVYNSFSLILTKHLHCRVIKMFRMTHLFIVLCHGIHSFIHRFTKQIQLMINLSSSSSSGIHPIKSFAFFPLQWTLYRDKSALIIKLRWCPSSTIGDKIVETSYSHRVTSENKRICTPPLTPPFKVGVIVVFYR